MFTTLCAYTALVAAFPVQPPSVGRPGDEHVPQKVELPAEGVTLPLLIRDGIPAVECSINGDGPHVMLLDTCGMGTIHPGSQLVEKLELEVVGQIEASDGSGTNSVMLDLVEVGELQLGKAKFHGLTGPTRDYGEGGRMAGDVAGILGVHLFADCLLTIDFPGKQVRIERGALPEPDGREVFALASQSMVPTITWPIGDQQVEAHVDTGNMGGISLSPELAKSLKLEGALQTVGEARTVTNRSAVRQARLGESLMLGRHELRKPLIVVLDFIPQANLGSQLLKHFVLTVDLKNERIRFARQGNEPLSFAPKFSVGIMLRRENEEVSIDDVVPGSAAEDAGLQAGDRVLAVDGKPLEEVGFDALRESFGKGEPVKLTLERGSETVEATVTPRKAE